MVAGTPALEGIINPPIDELLDVVDSKYGLVIMASKRARQINAYYAQLGEGLLEYVAPLVETRLQEKPLSTALREISDVLLTTETPHQALFTAASLFVRIILVGSAGIAAYQASERLRRLT